MKAWLENLMPRFAVLLWEIFSWNSIKKSDQALG